MSSQAAAFTVVLRNINETRPDYLYTEIRNPSSNGEVILELLQGVVKECSDSALTKAIVVNTIPAKFTVFDMFDLIVSLGEKGLNGVRLAVLNDGPKHRTMNDFVNIVADNRGIEMRIFASIRSAEVWLKCE